MHHDADRSDLIAKRVTSNIDDRMFLMRPVIEGSCTMGEVCTVLTLEDIADMHEALDLRDALLEDARSAKVKGR